LQNYLEGLFFKTASIYSHIVYVDGFAGPWQSANEQFEDTSLGIALNTLRRVGEARPKVQMTALLVERDPAAYARLETVRERYKGVVTIKTYPANFVSVVPDILRDIPKNAFAFYLIDPKGWRIPLAKLRPLLARVPSEVTFNFMFDFINRAANIADRVVISGLDELMPHGDWKTRLYEAEPIASVTATPEERKEILVAAFSESLRQIGNYRYVAETTVLKPLHDRTLYCLFYGTRHHQGLAVFRDAQVKALQAQAHARAAVKVKHATSSTGQTEFFDSLLEMGPNETSALLAEEKRKAEALIIEVVPASDYINYRTLWTTVLVQRVVRLPDVNALCAGMLKSGVLVFPDWETGKRVPRDHYRVQRAA
jgi:three-Cys-motif partner protein